MLLIQLTFSSINHSLQIGDTAYYTSYSGLAEFNVAGSLITEIGVVKKIDENTITCEISENTLAPPDDSFIFFSKENKANLASILGYYGEVEFKNNSLKKAELFATACDISGSSK